MLPQLCHRTLVLAAGLGLAGCVSTMEIRALATGRAEVAAYELTGADPAALRREAQRLCPAGGEVLRASSQDQVPEAVDGRIRGWLNAAATRLHPPQRSAQLMVLCRESAGAGALRADAAPGVPSSLPVGAPPSVVAPRAAPRLEPDMAAVAADQPSPAIFSPPSATPAAAPAAPKAAKLPAVKPPALPIGPITAQW